MHVGQEIFTWVNVLFVGKQSSCRTQILSSNNLWLSLFSEQFLSSYTSFSALLNWLELELSVDSGDWPPSASSVMLPVDLRQPHQGTVFKLPVIIVSKCLVSIDSIFLI